MADAWINKPYKQQQEEFVSNHGGELPNEVLLIFVPNVTSVVLTLLTLAFFDSHSYRNVRFFIQFVLIVIPSILCCTLLSDHLITVSLVMYLVILLINFISVFEKKLNKSKSKPKQIDNAPQSGKIAIITNFRAVTYLMTAICILAVDFPIFPRRFAKTENFGYSLMDSGVGLFVVSNALVSPEARKGEYVSKRYFFSNAFVRNLKTSIPLVALGVARALFIEYYGYQRHVSEYGVHWNFFLTLAIVKLFSSLVLGRISSKYAFIPGLWLLVMHEYVLTSRGFRDWILGYVPRDNFVTANREGLVSIPGYIGLYLCSVSIGKLVHAAYKSNNLGEVYPIDVFGRKFELSPLAMLFVQLFSISGTASAVTFICEQYFGVSRRLVNFGYAAWTITLSTLALTYFMLVDTVMNSLISAKSPRDARKRSPHAGHTLEMFEAINANGLCFFLLANLLTGVINLSIKTLYVSSLHAVRILTGYIGINVLTVLFLYRCRIQLKF